MLPTSVPVSTYRASRSVRLSGIEWQRFTCHHCWATRELNGAERLVEGETTVCRSCNQIVSGYRIFSMIYWLGKMERYWPAPEYPWPTP